MALEALGELTKLEIFHSVVHTVFEQFVMLHLMVFRIQMDTYSLVLTNA